MSTVYATVDDIEDELKSIYPDGFDADTDPTATKVTEKIAEVTTSLRVRVIRAIGSEPEAGSDAAVLVKRGVVADTVAWILRRGSLGYGEARVKELTQPYIDDYDEVVKQIETKPDTLKTPTTEEKRVGFTAMGSQRDPILSDDALNRRDTF